ncbi:MAG: IS1 family transposase, partial [Bacteroidales bacterium]
MKPNQPLSLRHVDKTKVCRLCKGKLVKFGTSSAGKQRYRCKDCKKTQVEEYSYNAYNQDINNNIVALLKEGVGIRVMARLLGISQNTVIKRIKEIAASIEEPALSKNKDYEVDELCTFVKKKDQLICIVIALQRDTKDVVSFAVGQRTKKTLGIVTGALLLSEAKKIFTDGLSSYKSLIKSKIHRVVNKCTNHVERL